MTKLFDRFMNRRIELWNDTEIATILTAPGTLRTAAGRKIWSKKNLCKETFKQVWLVLNTVLNLQ